MTTTEAKPATSPDDLLKAAIGAKGAAQADAPPRDAQPAEAKAPAPATPRPTMEIKVGADRTESRHTGARPPETMSAAAGRREGAAATSVLAAARRLSSGLRGTEPRLAAVAGTALVLGAILGAGALSLGSAHEATPNAAVLSLATAMEANRADTAKVAATLAKLEQGLTELKAATDAARKDGKGSAVSDRIGQLDKSLTAKIAGLGERIDQAEREQATRLSALSKLAVAKAEPTQTGSLAEPRERVAEKPAEAKAPEARPIDAKAEVRAPEPVKAAAPGRPPVLENLALRDVFEGAAIVEARNRRLYQVMPGDTLPGAGRVEGIERQGRNWVVVTRTGVVTPQPW